MNWKLVFAATGKWWKLDKSASLIIKFNLSIFLLLPGRCIKTSSKRSMVSKKTRLWCYERHLVSETCCMHHRHLTLGRHMPNNERQSWMHTAASATEMVSILTPSKELLETLSLQGHCHSICSRHICSLALSGTAPGVPLAARNQRSSWSSSRHRFCGQRPSLDTPRSILCEGLEP